MSIAPPHQLIGSGKEAEVFACGALALKLYPSGAPKRAVFREASVLALAESLGLPVPQVQGVQQIDGRWGVLMSRAEGPSFACTMRRHPDRVPACLQAMAALQAQIHSHSGQFLPALKVRLDADIRKAGALGRARQAALLQRLAGMPDGDRLCHGDFHPFNILGRPGDAVVIDWPIASRGDPAADVCRTYVLIKPSAPAIASDYLDACATVQGMTRDRILRWLPVIAAARLAEGVADETDGLLAMADTG